MEITEYDMWHSSNLVELEYATCLPVEFAALWNQGALSWLNEIYQSDRIQYLLKEYVAIFAQLKNEPVGPRRTRLVRRASRLVQETFGKE